MTNKNKIKKITQSIGTYLIILTVFFFGIWLIYNLSRCNNNEKIDDSKITYTNAVRFIESTPIKSTSLNEEIPILYNIDCSKEINSISSNSKEEDSETSKDILSNNPKGILQKPITYNEDDLYIFAHIINGESGGCSLEMQVAVGSVFLNRVNDERFPDTISGVAFQEGQYACISDGNYDKELSEQSMEVAKYLLENGSQLPSNVIWQAEFEQGNGVYKIIETPYSTMYFCYS